MQPGDTITLRRTIASPGGATWYASGGESGQVVRVLQSRHYDYDVRLDRTGQVVGVKREEIRSR